jgi:hypothetical protein
MEEFRLTSDVPPDGTHLLDEVFVAPNRLVSEFGPPADGDEYKVSGMYVFTGPGGEIFTVYDWKATTLFFDGEDDGEECLAPTREQFWASTNSEELHIGGKSEKLLDAFKKWLLTRVDD